MNDYIDTTFPSLTFNARLLLKELHKRNINLRYFPEMDIVKATKGSHTELLNDIFTSAIPYPVGIMADDKFYVKQLLKENGIHVTPGRVFTRHGIAAALRYAQDLGYPVVLKPTVGSHGDHIFLNISSQRELEEKIHYFLDHHYDNGYYLVEKQFSGNEFRLFVTNRGYFASVARTPPFVTGNGKDTIARLIEKENHRRMHPRTTCLCEIRIDELTHDFLKKHGIRLTDVPRKGENVYLRQNSNVSTGGNCYEVTDTVHPTIVQLAKQVLKIFDGLPFVGMDLLCQDVTHALGDYVICELNCAPGLSMHMMPEKGTPQNVAGAIADVLFPETA